MHELQSRQCQVGGHETIEARHFSPKHPSGAQKAHLKLSTTFCLQALRFIQAIRAERTPYLALLLPNVHPLRNLAVPREAAIHDEVWAARHVRQHLTLPATWVCAGGPMQMLMI